MITQQDLAELYHEISPNTYTWQPWWVVVVNPRRQPERPKFYKAFPDKASAEESAAEQQKLANEQAKRESEIRKKDWPAFRYYAVERQKGGVA